MEHRILGCTIQLAGKRMQMSDIESRHILTSESQWTNYGDMVYSISLAFTKISILLLVLRIFLSVQRNLFWWLTQFLIVVNSIFYTIFFFVPVFLCFPRAKIWNPDMPGHCLRIEILYLASCSFNMVSDIAMLSVPIYLIWNLQMSTQRKIGVSLIFGTGALSVKTVSSSRSFKSH